MLIVIDLEHKICYYASGPAFEILLFIGYSRMPPLNANAGLNGFILENLVEI